MGEMETLIEYLRQEVRDLKAALAEHQQQAQAGLARIEELIREQIKETGIRFAAVEVALARVETAAETRVIELRDRLRGRSWLTDLVLGLIGAALTGIAVLLALK